VTLFTTKQGAISQNGEKNELEKEKPTKGIASPALNATVILLCQSWSRGGFRPHKKTLKHGSTVIYNKK